MLRVIGNCCAKPVSNFLQCYIQWKNAFLEKIKLYQTFRTLKHTNFSRKPKTQAAKPLKKTQVTIRLHRNRKPRMRSLAPMVDKLLRLSTVTRCRYFQQQHNLLSAAFAMAMGVPPRNTRVLIKLKKRFVVASLIVYYQTTQIFAHLTYNVAQERISGMSPFYRNLPLHQENGHLGLI